MNSKTGETTCIFRINDVFKTVLAKWSVVIAENVLFSARICGSIHANSSGRGSVDTTNLHLLKCIRSVKKQTRTQFNFKQNVLLIRALFPKLPIVFLETKICETVFYSIASTDLLIYDGKVQMFLFSGGLPLTNHFGLRAGIRQPCIDFVDSFVETEICFARQKLFSKNRKLPKCHMKCLFD